MKYLFFFKWWVGSGCPVVPTDDAETVMRLSDQSIVCNVFITPTDVTSACLEARWIRYQK